MAIVGPGAVQEQAVDVKPLLDGASEFEYITIFNPLPDDFAVRVAQDIPVNMPFEIRKDSSGNTSGITNTEHDARQVYGLNLKNPDFTGRKHIYNDMIIKAGQTINLKGNEAQVAVRQLVNEILQRNGSKRLMADPHLRREIEEQIVKNRGSVQELMDKSLQTTRSQIDEAVNRSNEVQDEANLPGSGEEAGQEDQGAGIETNSPAGDDQVIRRPVGRPKKTN